MKGVGVPASEMTIEGEGRRRLSSWMTRCAFSGDASECSCGFGVVPEAPARPVQVVDPGRRGLDGLRHQRQQILEHEPGITRHAQGVLEVVGKQGGVEVDLQDLAAGARRRQGPFDGGDRSHLAAHIEQHVGFFHRAVGVRVKAVVAHHAQRQRVLVGHGALAGNGGDHRRAQALGQDEELLVGLRMVDAAAGHDHRPLARRADALPVPPPPWRCCGCGRPDRCGIRPRRAG